MPMSVEKGLSPHTTSLCNKEFCYEVDDDVLEAMLDTIEATTDRERGFFTCWDSEAKREIPGTRCTGEECYMRLYDCEGKPRLAKFHTHPILRASESVKCAASSPSTGDLKDALPGCVGGPRGKNLTCWAPRVDDLNQILMAYQGLTHTDWGWLSPECDRKQLEEHWRNLGKNFADVDNSGVAIPFYDFVSMSREEIRDFLRKKHFEEVARESRR